MLCNLVEIYNTLSQSYIFKITLASPKSGCSYLLNIVDLYLISYYLCLLLIKFCFHKFHLLLIFLFTSTSTFYICLFNSIKLIFLHNTNFNTFFFWIHYLIWLFMFKLDGVYSFALFFLEHCFVIFVHFVYYLFL